MSENTHDTKKTIHTIISLVIMFGLGFLPPVLDLTVSGMKILGILIGAIWGITFCESIWPCIAAMLAMIVLNVAPVGTVLSTGLGSDSCISMIFLFTFVAILEKYKITEFLATFLLSRNILRGKPWIFSYVLIIGTMFCGAFGSSFPAMIVFWSVLIATCKMYDMKPYTAYPTVMFMGICIGGLASSSTWLFRGNPLFVNSMIKNISGGELYFNFGIYALFSFVMWMIVIAGYILMCKYILKVDVSNLKNIDDSVLDKSLLQLNKAQKIMIAYTLLMLMMYVAIGFAPAGTAIATYLGNFGVTGPVLLVLLLASLTRVDGQPLYNFIECARKGIAWETLILCGALLSLSTIMMTTDTGIAASIISLLNPIFAGKSATFMCIVIAVVSVILTNFMANTTVGLMFAPVIYSFSLAMGFDALPMMAVMLISIHIAYLTPAASPFASLMFGFSDWIKPADIYKKGTASCIFMVIIFLLIGIPLSNILF